MRIVTVIGSVALLFAGAAWAQDAEIRKHLLHELGGPFIVSRTNVQEELKLSDNQKQKLRKKLSDYVQETMKVVEKIDSQTAEEREQRMQAHRQKSSEKLWPFLKEILKAEQFKRLQQLELQHEGPPALMGRPEIARELKVTDEQRKQFMGVIQDMQRKIAPMIKEAQSGGNPQAIFPKVVKIRKDYDGKIETLLSGAQKIRWKEMRGKPFDVFIDN